MLGASTDLPPLRGRCLCGEVRYASRGTPGAMWYCHCPSCARSSGVGFATWIAVPGVSWDSGQSQRARVTLSAELVRSFCRICGSQLPAERRDRSGALLPAGGLDSVHGLRPSRHAFAEQRMAWLPEMASLPACPAAPLDQPCGAPCAQPRSGDSSVLGSCLCGSVAFSLTPPLYAMRVCHCSRCRRRSGSTYFVGLACAASGLRVLRGEPSTRSWQLPTSSRYVVRFCAECGCSVPSVMGKTAFIAAGSLDSDPGVRTRCHVYVGSRAPWSEISDELPRFDRMPPPDFAWSADGL